MGRWRRGPRVICRFRPFEDKGLGGPCGHSGLGAELETLPLPPKLENACRAGGEEGVIQCVLRLPPAQSPSELCMVHSPAVPAPP